MLISSSPQFLHPCNKCKKFARVSNTVLAEEKSSDPQLTEFFILAIWPIPYESGGSCGPDFTSRACSALLISALIRDCVGNHICRLGSPRLILGAFLFGKAIPPPAHPPEFIGILGLPCQSAPYRCTYLATYLLLAKERGCVCVCAGCFFELCEAANHIEITASLMRPRTAYPKYWKPIRLFPKRRPASC